MRERAVKRIIGKAGDVLEFIFKQETTTEQSFVLSPLDTVNVNFLSSPAWNSLQRIRPNGAISLPYQSEIVIAGLTVPQATHKIEALYSKILKDPKIFVSLGDFQTKQEEQSVKNKKHQKLDKALDVIRKKYGEDAVKKGTLLK